MYELLEAAFGKEIREGADQMSAEEKARVVMNNLFGLPSDLKNVSSEPKTDITSSAIMLAITEAQQWLRENRLNFSIPHLPEVLSFEMGDLFDAIAGGKNHPLLEDWLNRRQNNRPSTSRKGRFLKDIAASISMLFKFQGLTFQLADRSVAEIANKSGVFKLYIQSNKLVEHSMIARWRLEGKQRNASYTAAGYEIATFLELEPIPKDSSMRTSHSFKFISEYARILFLSYGTSLSDQMAQLGVKGIVDNWASKDEKMHVK